LSSKSIVVDRAGGDDRIVGDGSLTSDLPAARRK
jgi:hypothetical protein